MLNSNRRDHGLSGSFIGRCALVLGLGVGWCLAWLFGVHDNDRWGMAVIGLTFGVVSGSVSLYLSFVKRARTTFIFLPIWVWAIPGFVVGIIALLGI